MKSSEWNEWVQWCGDRIKGIWLVKNRRQDSSNKGNSMCKSVCKDVVYCNGVTEI